jgi:hypothetical protein
VILVASAAPKIASPRATAGAAILLGVGAVAVVGSRLVRD